MITSKEDYLEYLRADREALGIRCSHPLWSTSNSMIWLTDPVYRWERLLRKVEYWENCHTSAMKRPMRVLLRRRFQSLSAHLGFSIPINIIGPGLKILHYGSIVISRHSTIGSNCTLNSCVNIGANPQRGGAPKIGDNVYIGPGAKLWNSIVIADNVTIGANACVSKDVTTRGATIIGINHHIGV